MITRNVQTNGFGKLYFDILFSRTSIQYISIHRMIDSINSNLRVGSHMADIYNNNFFVAYQHAFLPGIFQEQMESENWARNQFRYE